MFCAIGACDEASCSCCFKEPVSVRGEGTDSGRGERPGCGEFSCAAAGEGGMLRWPLTEGLGHGDIALVCPTATGPAGEEARFGCWLGAGDMPRIEAPGEGWFMGWPEEATIALC